MVIGGYSRYHPYIIVLQMAENYAFKHSDKVVSLLGNAKAYMVVHGLDPDKFVHVPNGFDRDEFLLMQENVPLDHQQIIDKVRKDGKNTGRLYWWACTFKCHAYLCQYCQNVQGRCQSVFYHSREWNFKERFGIAG